MDATKKAIINNEYDYSNVLPTVESIRYMVEYCSDIYQQFLQLVEKDEEKNCQFREEYRNYEYRKDFNSGFYVFIREKNSQNISCDDKEDFIAAIEDGNLKQVSSISIRLELHFSKGNSYRLESHKNVFLIAFEPYSIRFSRQSNFKDENMDQIEESIHKIFKSFAIANTVFCDKRN